MSRVLLVTTYFAPDNTIAAIRTTKLVKYMLKYGYSVDVIAVKNSNLDEDEILSKDVSGVKVRRIENTMRYEKVNQCINKIFGELREKGFNDLSDRKKVNPRSGKVEFYPYETAHPWIASVFYSLAMFKEYDLYRNVKADIAKMESYDFLVTSYGDEFCYYFGKKYHKLHPETRWIFDIRDAIYRYKFIPGPLAFIPLYIEHVAWKKADVITGVSKGICMRVDMKNRRKVHLVTNGYDEGDRLNKKKNGRSDILTFAFTGSMYGGTRDLSVFFKALRELINKGMVDQNKLLIEFAGSKSAENIFISQAKKYSVENLVLSHGKVDRDEALAIQDRADVLLAPSYDYEKGNGGIITGKIFEYMTAEKPVIAIIVGDIQHSELADIVRKTNLGIAYEEAHDNIDYINMYEYIHKIYGEKIENGHIEFYPNRNKLKKFDYRYISRRFIRIMDPDFGRVKR